VPVGEVCRCGLGWFGYAPRIRHLTAGGRGVVMARFEVPEGWTAQAYRFALDPTPTQERALRSHAGARNFAFNTMLAAVKANLDQRAAEKTYGLCRRRPDPGFGLVDALAAR